MTGDYTINVSAGKNITGINDPLSLLAADKLFDFIVNPTLSHKAQIEQLRMLLQIAPDAYRQEKKRLPYFVCASFVPSVRLTRNFASASSFVVDVDHLADKAIEPELLRQKLMADSRVLMLFLSPGGDGFKVMFRFETKCDDATLYALFYKKFTKEFAEAYGLEQAVDARTCDITRACFMSLDPRAYYNPVALAIDWEAYLPMESDLGMEQLEVNMPLEPNGETKQEVALNKPEKEMLDQIRLTLNPVGRLMHQREVVVPEQLSYVVPLLQTKIEERGIVLAAMESIQYGKKMRFALGVIWAEINLFYGKNGFSVVKTTKTGSNMDLAEVMAQLIREELINLGAYVR